MSNLSVATRELFTKTKKAGILGKIGLFTRLLMDRRVNWEGGTKITAPVDVADMDSLGQDYKPGEPMTSGTKTLLAKPAFEWKYTQVPVVITAEEKLQNGYISDEQVAPEKLVKFYAMKAQRAARLKVYSNIWGAASTTSDTDAGFQGVPDALTHDYTYGTLARATTVTNLAWQGASVAGTYSDGATAMSPSIDNIRSMIRVVTPFIEDQSGLLVTMGGLNFQRVKSQMEARHMYTRDGSKLAKYGFNTMMLDNVEVLEDVWLDNNANSATTRKFLSVLNIPDWEFRLHPQRDFMLTDFVWQGDRPNGADEDLARVMIAGNFVCWNPHGSCLRTNVS